MTDLLDLATLDGPNHDVPQMFYWVWVRPAWRPVNGISSFILQKLPAYQGEPRTHCTNEGSNNGSKDFIPVPNGRVPSFTLHRSVRPSVDKPPQTYADPPQNWSCWVNVTGIITFMWLLQTLPGLSHESALTCGKNGHQCQTCQFQCSLENASQVPRCRAVSTGPTWGRRALRQPWSLFCNGLVSDIHASGLLEVTL